MPLTRRDAAAIAYERLRVILLRLDAVELAWAADALISLAQEVEHARS